MTPEREKLLSPNWLRLPKEADRARYNLLMEMAPDMTIDLAFIFQKSVGIEVEFLAPLYLFQAEKFTIDYKARQELMKALTTIQEL